MTWTNAPVVQAVGRHSLPRVSERPSSKASCVSGGSDSARSNPPARSPAAKSGPPIGCMFGSQSVRFLSCSSGTSGTGTRKGGCSRGVQARMTSRNASMRVR